MDNPLKPTPSSPAIAEIELKRKHYYADIEICNQDGELVAIGRHILQWIPNPSKKAEG